jgi:hypothetical protein
MATTEDREQDAWSQIGAILAKMFAAGWFPTLKIETSGRVARVELRIDPFGFGAPDVREWTFEFSEVAQRTLAVLEAIKQKENEQWDSKKI